MKLRHIAPLMSILCACSANPYIERHNQLVRYYMANPIEAHAVANTEPPDFTNLLNVMNDTTAINNEALDPRRNNWIY